MEYAEHADGRMVHLDVPLSDEPLAWQRAGLTWTATGYGTGIATSKVAHIGGKRHRVYCNIYSNSGTCYVQKGGFKFIVA